jgi:predicted dehydrogenase
MIKIGIIGLGKWGKNHLKVFSGINDCDLIGFADPDLNTKETAEEYDIKHFSNYQDLLKEVDAVTVVAPTNLHYEIVKNCLNAGKHVLVEKPITLNPKEAEELIELAKSKKLILSVGYLFRFNNSVKKLKEISKHIGEIHYITSRYIHSTKPPRKDSGAILNLGIHMIDILNFILNDKPKTVFCKKNNLLSKEMEDSAIMLLNYKNFAASIEVSCCHPEKKRDMWIIGSNEKVYIDFLKQEIVRYPIKVSYEEIIRKKEIKEDIIPNEPLKDELIYFCNCITEKDSTEFEKIENIGKEEIYSTKICTSCLKSAETGEEITL